MGKKISGLKSSPFNLHSRVHPLNGYLGGDAWIKRDDELGSGITGSKLRKLAGIIPEVMEGEYDEIVLLGSARSNFISAALQLFNENRIKTKLFLLESNDKENKGNNVWISLLHDTDTVEWINRAEWGDVLLRAEAYCRREALKGKKIMLLPEGGRIPSAVRGAMSLADDIRRNEEETGRHFRHIFVDSGTGLTAIGMLLGFEKAEDTSRHFYITLIAGKEDEFRKNYHYFRKVLIGADNALDNSPELHFLHLPINASFGATGPAIRKEVRLLARLEGILAEPVYTIKHLMAVRAQVQAHQPGGAFLVINSGGALGLAGFQEQLLP